MSWLGNHSFVLSGSLRGGSLVASYPFDSRITPSHHGLSDDDVFRQLATSYAEQHPTMKLGHPSCPGASVAQSFPGGIARGSSWKAMEHSMQDYHYMKKSCFDVSFYIGCCKYPLANTLENFWEMNKKPLVYYIHQVCVLSYCFFLSLPSFALCFLPCFFAFLLSCFFASLLPCLLAFSWFIAF